MATTSRTPYLRGGVTGCVAGPKEREDVTSSLLLSPLKRDGGKRKGGGKKISLPTVLFYAKEGGESMAVLEVRGSFSVQPK